MISVLDMNTGTYTDYSLSPHDAVIAAYAQREKRNFNTWTYGKYASLVTISESIKPDVVCVTCGNQTCLARKGNEHNEYQHDYEIDSRAKQTAVATAERLRK